MKHPKPLYIPLTNHALSDLEENKLVLLTHRNVKSVEAHDHAFLELSYILGGQAEHDLDGQITQLRMGDYLIVDYGSHHSYRATVSSGFDNLDCLFLPEFLDPVLKGTKSLRALLEHYLLHFNPRALVQNPARIVFHDSTGRIRELIARMEEEHRQKQAGYSEVIRCHLIEILVLTLRQLEDAQPASSGDDISAFLVSYVAEHYMEPITLQEISARLNYSLSYVSKKFKEDMGISFVHYLQNYRVMEGCRLLAGSKRTLAEITEMVGYHDVKFFSALVKSTTGLSPTNFRRRNRRGED